MAEINFTDLRQLLIKNCMLRVSPDQIHEDTPLFGPGGLGLDSIDVLQLTVAIETDYGIVIREPEVAREAFRSLGSLKDWLLTELKKIPEAT